MLYLSIALFSGSAVLGLVILVRWLSKTDASRGIIYAHGIAAATALVILGLYSFQNPADFPRLSLILFVIAALGGFYLFFSNMKSGAKPVAIAFIHALLAVGAFVTLLLFVFG